MTIGIVAAVLMLATVSGCGVLDWSDSSSGDAGGSAPVEKSKIAVGTMPIIDVASIHIAISRGYFKEEGLEVELKTIQGGAAGIPALVKGELDISWGNWVSFILTQSRKVADLKLIADGYQAAPGMFMVIAPGDSPIKGARDLAGKTVAVNTLANIAELTIRSVLGTYDVDPSMVSLKELQFPDMHAALVNKQVDAAFLVEPYITAAALKIGAVPVVDLASGPTANIPIAGYAASAKFAKDNPRTVEAFRRALAKGQRDAADRPTVESMLPSYTQVDTETAQLVQVGVFPTTLNPTRLQRVADLMKANRMLDQPMDVRPMIMAGPQ